jgi:hypothetical protein
LRSLPTQGYQQIPLQATSGCRQGAGKGSVSREEPERKAEAVPRVSGLGAQHSDVYGEGSGNEMTNVERLDAVCACHDAVEWAGKYKTPNQATQIERRKT